MNLSFILPFYKRYDEFLSAFLHNAGVFERPGVEVVLVLDEPSERDSVKELLSESLVCSQMVVNPEDHPWRPPCKAINVGLRHATMEYVCIISPETQIDVPYPSFLVDYDFGWDRQIYVSGVMHYGRKRGEPFSANHPLGFGMLLVRKSALEEIGGYDEGWAAYGGDDDDVRRRLVANGYTCVASPQIRLSHYANFDSTAQGGHVPRTKDHFRGGSPVVKNGGKDGSWGRSFGNL